MRYLLCHTKGRWMMAFLGMNRKQRFTSNPLHNTTETLVGGKCIASQGNILCLIRTPWLELEAFHIRLCVYISELWVGCAMWLTAEKSPCRSPELSSILPPELLLRRNPLHGKHVTWERCVCQITLQHTLWFSVLHSNKMWNTAGVLNLSFLL